MKCIPNKFLGRFPLNLGALVVGVVMLCVLAIFAIAMLVQILYVKNCELCNVYAWRNCFGYSITGFIYVMLMILANAWFFWGVKKKKASVVLSWIVVSSMWLALVFFLLIVLLSLHYSRTGSGMSALFALIFGLLAIAILVYGLLVIIGYWLELKNSKYQVAAQNA